MPTEVTPIARERYLTLNELEKHNSSADCWVALMGKVYDITTIITANQGNIPPLLPTSTNPSTN